MLELAARSIGGLCSRALHFPGGKTLEELILANALGWPTPAAARHPAGAAGVFMLPVPRPGVLRAIEGHASAAAVPGITGLTITIPTGQRVRPLPEGDRYLGFIFAEGNTRRDVENALNAARERQRVTIQCPARAQTTPAHPQRAEEQPGQDGEHRPAGPVIPSPGFSRRSTATCWRGTSSSASFEAAERASRTFQPARGTKAGQSIRPRSCHLRPLRQANLQPAIYIPFGNPARVQLLNGNANAAGVSPQLTASIGIRPGRSRRCRQRPAPQRPAGNGHPAAVPVSAKEIADAAIRPRRAAAPLLGQARAFLRQADGILRPAPVRRQPPVDLLQG